MSNSERLKVVGDLIDLAAHGSAEKPVGTTEWSVAVTFLADEAESAWNRRSETTQGDGSGGDVVDEVIIAPDVLQDLIQAAYERGAHDVHANHQPDADPDFKEAAWDYVASLDFTTTTRPHRAALQSTPAPALGGEAEDSSSRDLSRSAEKATPTALPQGLFVASSELLAVAKAVRDACLYEDDDFTGVSEDVVIPSALFDRICTAINTAECPHCHCFPPCLMDTPCPGDGEGRVPSSTSDRTSSPGMNPEPWSVTREKVARTVYDWCFNEDELPDYDEARDRRIGAFLCCVKVADALRPLFPTRQEGER